MLGAQGIVCLDRAVIRYLEDMPWLCGNVRRLEFAAVDVHQDASGARWCRLRVSGRRGLCGVHLPSRAVRPCIFELPIFRRLCGSARVHRRPSDRFGRVLVPPGVQD